MGSLKLQSFEEFSNASAKAAKVKLEEEQSAARNEAAYQFKTLLTEFGVTSIKDLNEEDRNSFYRKLGATEISESVAIIEEGTRSQIGLINKRGKIKSVYMHYDGYPDHMLPTIKKGKYDAGTVKTLLGKGGGSYLEPDWRNINFYGDKTTLDGDVNRINKYIRDASNDGGAEFVYLFDERDGKWYMADVYAETGLQKAFESMVINERFVPSKGNLRDAKKVKKALEQFFMDHNALMDKAIFLGVCKYLVAESLTDANFHSYREPVSKVIKGKLSTIFVEIDGLNNMKIPVGKKSIITLLDEVGPFMASAAGWSGIGIVEGMALFLDSFGQSDLAQKIVDEFNLIFQNESVVNEGNAFLAARAKAIEEDAEEFEFNGKKFPVIKEEESTEVEEGNAFGAARAEAIAKGDDKFKVGDEEFDVESVDAEDKENAEEFADEEGIKTENEEVTEDEIEIKVDGDYEIEVEKEDGEEEESEEEAPAEEEVEETKEVNEGLHPKLKKAMKAVDKGETVYGENIRFPGRFKIIELDNMFATVDYEDGTDPMQMASMNIRIDSLQFESVTNEAEVKSDEEFKEYAFSVLGQAFGDKFDEEKAQEVIDGLLDKHGDDYGAAVGALQSSLG